MLREHRLAVSRTARFYTLGEPGPAVREIWIACHGYGQLAERFLRDLSALDDGTRLVVAPEALSRFYLDSAPSGRHADRVGASWMTREDRASEIADYLDYLDGLHRRLIESLAGSVRLGVLGFSQGGATAARWVLGRKAPAQVLVLWGASLPEDVSGPGFEFPQRLRCRLVAGEEDRYVDRVKLAEQAAVLASGGADCRLVSYPGGHRIDPVALLQVAAELMRPAGIPT